MQTKKTDGESAIPRFFATAKLVGTSMLVAIALAACGGGGGGSATPAPTAPVTTLIPTDGKYVATNFSGAVADSTLSVGLLGMQIVAPNDLGGGVVYGNYFRGDLRKLGLLWLDRIGGSISVLEESAGSSQVIGSNDSGGLIYSTSPSLATITYTYKLVTRLPSGLPSVITLAVPSGRMLSGLLNNGNILSIGTPATIVAPVGSAGLPSPLPSPTGTIGTPTVEYDASFNVLRTLSATGIWSGFGKDGLLYGTDATTGVQTVRFADSTTVTLPCNPIDTSPGSLATMPGNTALTRPTTGRNCNMLVASGTGMVVGRYFKSDGSQGVYRFTKTGFEEIPLAADFFSTSGTLNSQSIRGVANDGTMLVSPRYTDNTCIAGPFLIEGAAVVDLRLYLPTQSCFNINASISGGGNVFVWSQAQGVAAVIGKKK